MFYRSETCRRFLRDPVRGTNCTPHQFSIDLVQKHSETALDTPKKEGTAGGFSVKTHLIVLHKECLSVKSRGFTDEVVKMTVSSVKLPVFTDELKKHAQNSPLGGTTVAQKGKCKCLVSCTCALSVQEKAPSVSSKPFLYPEPKPRYCCILRSKLT